MVTIKYERQVFVSKDLSPEEQARVRKELEKHVQGWEQAHKGEQRREIAEVFLGILAEGSKARVETEIERLHGIQDRERFRTQLILLLMEAYLGGVASPIRMELPTKKPAKTD